MDRLEHSLWPFDHFFSPYILETVESVCDPEETRFEKERENIKHG